jgi:hypothetical protein
VLCNRVLAKAVEADSSSGRDVSSVETTDRLIVGGMVALIAGPILAAFAVGTQGLGPAAMAPALSIVPMALGIDAIGTGLRRRKARKGPQFTAPASVAVP